jgi:branched-subunit amino acid transport protein
MSSWDVWLTIGVLTFSTVLTRCTFALFGQSVKLPPKLQYALSYAPAAVMAGIIVPELFLVGGEIALNPVNPKVLAAIGGTVFFLWTRHMLGTVIVGMGLFTVLRLVM